MPATLTPSPGALRSLTRLLRAALTLLGVATATFALGRLTGDPVALLLPQSATVADYAAMRARMGLDDPLPTQYLRWLRGVAAGDFGTSIVYNRPASTLVLERLPATLRLGGWAFAVAFGIAVPLGILAAVRRGGRFDRLVRDASLALQSVPSFVVGIVAILTFGVTLRWLPTFGADSALHHLLPVATLAIGPLALLLRLTRSSLLEVLGEDYVRTGRAKGVPEAQVVLRHALRNALAPIVTVAGLQLAGLVTGAVVVETVFAWPGVGTLAVGAIAGRDYPIVQAMVLLSATAFVAINLLVDLLYDALDPRARGGA